MGKQSGFLRKLQENQWQNMHLQRLFTIQQCEDMALIAGTGFRLWREAGHGVFGEVPRDL